MRTLLAMGILFGPSGDFTALSAAEKPNIVFILADDLGWADLGCYGSKYHKTPNLDRLAAKGIRFTSAYAAAPVGTPTRAALMTGKYPARLHLTESLPGPVDRPDQKMLCPTGIQELPATEATLPALLKANGYKTGLIGKWNLAGKDATPLQRGFDFNVGGNQASAVDSYFAPFVRKDQPTLPGLPKTVEGEYLTDRLTEEAERFIVANKAEPFFLFVAHYAPHSPLQAKPEKIAKYKAGGAGQQGNPAYAAMLESLDDSVGRILKQLDDLKLSEQTIIVFGSDNGGQCVADGGPAPTINAPLREGKGYLYEGGIRVPLIVHVPGLTKPGTSNLPVHSIDLLPTLLGLAGINHETKNDGISLVPLLKNESIQREALYWHYPHYSSQGGRPSGAIRVGDYKLIEFYESGRRELFDVVKDVGESRNMILDKAELAKQLGEKLDAWRKQVDAQMMKPNPAYLPNPEPKNGNIVLTAQNAEVHGVMLRYEPLPHKNTLGFWTRSDDFATWEFTITRGGKFTVEVLQGCGKGQGESEVDILVDRQKVSFVVEDTGGFQNFKAREIGTIDLEKPGRYTLTVQPKRKAGVAVMDLRSVTLKRQEK